ncbi:hypothetical protein C8Q78DRAFT_992596 [Trametes maxima]|nr:hypothetical protein C8Q78DRAFT_992596 [Trametes maxima]
MSDLGYNVWGVVAGVIGVVALLPLLVNWFNARLPSARIAPLMELLNEVEELFFTALRESLFTSQDELFQANLNLCAARIKADAARAKAHSARTWKQDFKNWWHGLSDRIFALHEELNVMRVRLAEGNSLARKQRASQHSVDELPHTLLLDHKEHVPSHQTDPTPTGSPVTSMQLGVQPNPEYFASKQGVKPPLSPCDDVLPSREDVVCWGGHRLVHLAKDQCHSADSPPRHRLVSELDLQDLLSLALASPPSGPGGGKRYRETRHRLLLRFGRELHGPQPTPVWQPESIPYRHPIKRSRFKAFSRLLRSTYEPGRDANLSLPRAHGFASQYTQRAGGDDEETGEWQDEA